MLPKGKLLIIGGAEDKVGEPPDIIEQKAEFTRYEILRELLPTKSEKKIEIITTGTELQNEVKRTYLKVFHAMGYKNIGFIPILERYQGHRPAYLKRAQNAGAIFFTGGDQFRIASIIGGTQFADVIKKRYLKDPNFIIAGTSAGAMIMSSTMIIGGEVTEALIHNNLRTSSGLDYLPNCIIDTHFIKRGRFGRLAHAIIMNPEKLGIGLGEDTALIIKNGYDAECRGSGMVVIIDGKEIDLTNISTVTDNESIYVENLKVHLLVKGCRFSLTTRLFSDPPIKMELK